MKLTSSRLAAMLASSVTLLGGCSMSSEVTAVSVRADNGHVVTEQWNRTARCGLAPEPGVPCDAHTWRQRVETDVEP
jgi:hypothetical protein